MSSSDSRREVMNSQERVFARLCLEHGWATRSQIAEVVRTRSEAPGGAAPPLSALLIVRGVLTLDQSRMLEKQVAEVTHIGAYAEVRDMDESLGQILVESGSATADQVSAALALQKETAARNVPAPRLAEILIDQGVLTYAALQEAQRRGIRPPKPASRETAPVPTPASSDPPDVAAAAANSRNVLGKYVLMTQIGKGAMGTVYKAWDRGLRRWVALKALLAAADPELVLRFRREAETAAAIQHPNIVPIYDVGESEGRPFLVMKFVEGSTLSGMSLGLEQACSVVLQAARGVAYAHEQGVVHRDLKPENIMVDGTGHVLVMDFGLARDLFAAGMTAPGTVMGTPSYMPPEQAAGKNDEVDRSSDVYSLGAILYELVTGHPPFQSPKAMETIRQVIQDPIIPPSTTRADIPAELERVILTALDKDKTKRFPTAGAFAKALERVAPGTVKADPSPRPTPAPTPLTLAPSRSTTIILFWAGVLLVLSILSGLGVLHLLRGGAGIPH
jgi:serine/threonine protein kinase